MNRKVFWGIFPAAQLVGALGTLTGSPHGNPFGLLVAFIFLFPGSLLCWPLLDRLRIQTTGGPVIVCSLIVNLFCWYLLDRVIARVRDKIKLIR